MHVLTQIAFMKSIEVVVLGYNINDNFQKTLVYYFELFQLTILYDKVPVSPFMQEKVTCCFSLWGLTF